MLFCLGQLFWIPSGEGCFQPSYWSCCDKSCCNHSLVQLSSTQQPQASPWIRFRARFWEQSPLSDSSSSLSLFYWCSSLSQPVALTWIRPSGALALQPSQSPGIGPRLHRISWCLAPLLWLAEHPTRPREAIRKPQRSSHHLSTELTDPAHRTMRLPRSLRGISTVFHRNLALWASLWTWNSWSACQRAPQLIQAAILTPNWKCREAGR